MSTLHDIEVETIEANIPADKFIFDAVNKGNDVGTAPPPKKDPSREL